MYHTLDLKVKFTNVSPCLMLVDSFIDADRLLLRVQIIEQSRPPLRWCDHNNWGIPLT